MIDNPYLIDIPFCFHFSGGRTSGYLLRHVLDAYGGIMPPCGVEGFEAKPCPIVFTNTGKEFEQTLEFVRECGERWGVPVHWVEWRDKTKKTDPGFEIVTFETASRNGEPFLALTQKKRMLPNVYQRMCTQHLKILACDRFLKSYWGLPDYSGVTGIRYDEPKRWKSGGPDSRNSHRITVHPLRWARVDQAAVLDWWARQPFNLQLQPWESNCDLCFLKSNKKRVRIMADHPEAVDWWLGMEGLYKLRNGQTATFRPADRKGYAQLQEESGLLQLVESAPVRDEDFMADDLDDLIDCNCTD